MDVVVVVEILFCIADQTGNGAQYYDGDKVTAESQGYNKQASTKERKTQKTQTANTQKEKREGEKKKKKEEESTVESQLSHDSKSKPRCWLTIKINLDAVYMQSTKSKYLSMPQNRACASIA